MFKDVSTSHGANKLRDARLGGADRRRLVTSEGKLKTNYATVGRDDLVRSKAFYDAILAPLNGRILTKAPKLIYYSCPGDGMLPINLLYDSEACRQALEPCWAKRQIKYVVDQVHESPFSEALWTRAHRVLAFRRCISFTFAAYSKISWRFIMCHRWMRLPRAQTTCFAGRFRVDRKRRTDCAEVDPVVRTVWRLG